MSGGPPGGRGDAGYPGPDAAFSAVQLPGVRNRLIGSLLLPPRDNLTRAVIAAQAAGGAQRLADPAVTDPYAQAGLLLANEVARLRAASLFWVSPGMTALCRAAAPAMPAFRPGPGDFPAACGLMYFAAPLDSYMPLPRLVLGDHGGQLLLASSAVPVCAVAWGPWDERGRWPGGGTWFTFYTPAPSREELAAANGLSPWEAAQARLPPLILDHELACPASDAVPLDRPLGEAVRDPSSVYAWMHLVLCACRMMATSRTAAVTSQVPPRPVRRQAARARVTLPGAPVRLVDLPRPAARSRAAGLSPGARHGPRVRFPVTGHWRNQWFPGSHAHRPVWIDGYVKGPDGAPFRAPHTVYVMRRRGEPPGPRRGPDLEM